MTKRKPTKRTIESLDKFAGMLEAWQHRPENAEFVDYAQKAKDEIMDAVRKLRDMRESAD